MCALLYFFSSWYHDVIMVTFCQWYHAPSSSFLQSFHLCWQELGSQFFLLFLTHKVASKTKQEFLKTSTLGNSVGSTSLLEEVLLILNLWIGDIGDLLQQFYEHHGGGTRWSSLGPCRSVSQMLNSVSPALPIWKGLTERLVSLFYQVIQSWICDEQYWKCWDDQENY